MNTYKVNCRILGSSCVGKTTFLKLISTGEYIKNYEKTTNNTPYLISFYYGLSKNGEVLSNNDAVGIIEFHVVDTVSSNNYGHSDSVEEDDITVIMFDCTNMESWIDALLLAGGSISYDSSKSIVFIGNKADEISEYKIKEYTDYLTKMNISVHYISCKNNKNITSTFLDIARLSLGEAIEHPAKRTTY